VVIVCASLLIQTLEFGDNSMDKGTVQGLETALAVSIDIHSAGKM